MTQKKETSSVVFSEWEAPIRYFEKKPAGYFKALVALGVLLSLLFYFLSETLLIVLVWMVVFVAYVKATVPPPSTLFKLTKFGIQFFETNVPYTSISGFTVVKKKEGELLRIFTSLPAAAEFFIVLPADQPQKAGIVEFLKEKAPYIEKIPRTDIEKIASFLERVTGFG